MSLFKPLFLAILLLAGVSAAFCQTEIVDPGARQICASVKDAAPPALDRPDPAEEKTLAGCSSVDAYFGLGQAADPVKARKCAYAEVDRGEKSLLRGPAILMMVYANAKGVPRNFDLAMHFACAVGGAPGDSAGRIHQLDRLRRSNWTGDNLSICDHSSGRELYEQCAILSERFDRIERDRKFDDLSAHWTPRQQQAFHSFLREADRFFKVQAANGVNLQGTFEIQEEAFLWNNLLSTLERFERGELPKSTAEDFRRSEDAEKAAYQRTQGDSAAQWGTITPASVRRSEEEWRRYAGAWISFARQKYPGVSEQSWKAWLDDERATAIGRFLH